VRFCEWDCLVNSLLTPKIGFDRIYPAEWPSSDDATLHPSSQGETMLKRNRRKLALIVHNGSLSIG
jgi:hypothetical protein